MLRRRIGRIRLEDEKIFALAYTDDIVLLTVEEKRMKEMLEKMKKYVEEKKLEMDTGKLQTMRFRKNWEEGKVELVMEGKEVERSEELKYLGYMVQAMGESMTSKGIGLEGVYNSNGARV